MQGVNLNPGVIVVDPGKVSDLANRISNLIVGESVMVASAAFFALLIRSQLMQMRVSDLLHQLSRETVPIIQEEVKRRLGASN